MNVENAAIGDLRGKGEGRIPRNKEIIARVVLQFERVPRTFTKPTTDPLILNPGCVHDICTLVTFVVTVPVPFTTVQTCAGFEGWVRTVTAYVAAGIKQDPNVKGRFLSQRL